jgi:hypothetical protein
VQYIGVDVAGTGKMSKDVDRCRTYHPLFVFSIFFVVSSISDLSKGARAAPCPQATKKLQLEARGPERDNLEVRVSLS